MKKAWYLVLAAILSILVILVILEKYQIVTKINEVLTMLAVLVGSVLVIFCYVDLSPKVDLQIEPTWVGSDNKFLKLRLSVKNISRVRLNKPRDCPCRVQVLEYECPRSDKQGNILEKCLSEWVPFERDKEEPTDNGEPKQKPQEKQWLANGSNKGWVDPDEIFKTTKKIDPGEIISGERLYFFPDLQVPLKIGLQFKGRLGFFARRANILKFRKPQEESQEEPRETWTITHIVVKDNQPIPKTKNQIQNSK
jgi:hypothetical protein